LIGGESNATEEYDPATDTWTMKTPMPIIPYSMPEWNCASAVVDNKIYVIGLGVGVAIHHVYNPSTDSWSSITPWPSGAHFGVAGATTGLMAPDRIYVFGVDVPYWDLNLPNFRTLMYNPENDNWTVGATMPTGRIRSGTAVLNDTLYVIGGYTLMIGNNVFPSSVNEQYIPAEYIPEFPSWTPLLVMLVAVVAVTVIYRHNLKKHNQGSF